MGFLFVRRGYDQRKILGSNDRGHHVSLNNRGRAFAIFIFTELVRLTAKVVGETAVIPLGYPDEVLESSSNRPFGHIQVETGVPEDRPAHIARG
jgi:hypothetical protein